MSRKCITARLTKSFYLILLRSIRKRENQRDTLTSWLVLRRYWEILLSLSLRTFNRNKARQSRLQMLTKRLWLLLRRNLAIKKLLSTSTWSSCTILKRYSLSITLLDLERWKQCLKSSNAPRKVQKLSKRCFRSKLSNFSWNLRL